MKILVVEDDDNKRHQLVTFLIETYCKSKCTEAKSYQSGLKAIIQERYDIVFLDMTMPTFDRAPADGGGRIRPFAGRDIFAQIASRKISQQIIVFTMFEVLGEGGNQVTARELDRQLSRLYPQNYMGLVYYNAASSEWKGRVKELISQIKEAQ
ncbi:response regulator [Caballeronia sp. AZ1_KS37]|uniref:response regulator n=1 Tax=Caballeronia sp. AZ1_KS37 TaxID=2921756 RepID=UPI002028EB39|nr:response regulator [Caballeronia sp. AZ1_KS37]